jgi:beta-lactamase superfamily II metal-dependent hydrolase
MNSYSIVLKTTFNGKSFLLTGDAEADSEHEILEKGFDIAADVLKVGHHGSVSSTSDDFLHAVSPEYAVICCGADNSYGHPHQETMDKLIAAGITIFRTDMNGTVTFTVIGDELTVDMEKNQ